MKRSRLLVVLTAILCVLLASAAIAQTSIKDSNAGLGKAVGGTANLVTQVLANTVGKQNAALAYWTPERMAAAKPRNANPLLPNLLNPSGKTATAIPTTNSATSPQWTNGGAVASTVGKVFFTLGSSDYLCTATSIVSNSRDLLVTAAHCAHEGPGTFATNWTYIPGYSSGAEPYGKWTARALHVAQQWTSNGDLNYDFAYVDLNTNNGQHIADAVGTQSIAFQGNRGEYVHSFGYPALGEYDGETLHLCQDTPHQDTRGGTGQGIGCDMTEGSSGGPWFASFDASNGFGTVVSVNSFGYEDTPDVMWGPYLGETARALYDAVQG